MLSQGQTATETRVSKATISRAIASGRISAARNDAGNGADKPTATPDETATAHPKAEIEALRTQLAAMRELADEFKSQRDAWQRQAEASKRLLVDQRPAQPAGRRGIFGWRKAG